MYLVLYILLSIWLVWAFFITCVMRRQYLFLTKQYAKEDPAIAEKYDCFRRKDMSKWNLFEIHFCAIFLLPIRIVHFLISLILCTLLMKLCLMCSDPSQPLGPCRRALVKGITRALARSCLLAFGFYWIKNVKLNISDVDPTYPKEADSNVPAPVLVCDHVSWLDIFIQMASAEAPGFMAKAEVANYPLVGRIAKAIGCLFVQRENKEGRDDVVAKLKERLERVKTHPRVTPKVLIFPEGTTSNGEYLLSFKKGAFFQLTPVHITAIKYTSSRFSPAYDLIGITRGFLFTLCQLYNGVTFYDLGIYNPEHLNLRTEEDWPIYSQKIKGILQKVLDVKTCELGYSDKNEYEKYLKNLNPRHKTEDKKKTKKGNEKLLSNSNEITADLIIEK